MRRSTATTAAALLLAIACALAAAAVVPGRGARAAGIETEAPTERSADPSSITFSVRVRTPSGLKSATLDYTVRNPFGDIGGSQPGTFSPGAETDVSYTLATNSTTRFIPVGSNITYHWVLVANDGSTAETPPRSFVFLDRRYSWQSRTQGQITVYWYGNNAAKADAAFGATADALQKMGALLETKVDYPIRVMLYGNPAEGQGALEPGASEGTLGERVAPDLVLILSPDVNTIRHEVTHIVTRVAGDGPFTQLPFWMDEGTAVYAQTSPEEFGVAVRVAIASNSTIPLRSLRGKATRADLNNLWYGESWSVIDFLVSQYGQQQFAQFFRVHRAGSAVDAALSTVYGFDQDALYNRWREAKGLPPVPIAATPPGSGTASPGAQATLPPLGVAGANATATPAAADSRGSAPADGGSNAAAGVAVGLGTLLVAGLLGGGAFVLLRRSRRGRAAR